MKKNIIYLNHILDSIEEINDFTKDGFDQNDLKTERAVERNLEIIGEAANNLSKDFQKKFNEISWELVIGIRHKIIHDYFDVDANVVKNTVEKDIPVLKKQILQILKKLRENN